MSLKSVRWKESLTSSLSKMDTTEKCFASQRSKKSSVPDSPANKCKSSEKATAKMFAVGAEMPSVVSVYGSSGSCPQIAASVCKCAWLCSVIACHHFTLLMRSPLVLIASFTCGRAGAASVALRRGAIICLALGKCAQIPANLDVDPIQFTRRCCVRVEACDRRTQDSRQED